MHVVAKRKMDEIQYVSDVSKISPCAKVNGVLNIFCQWNGQKLFLFRWQDYGWKSFNSSVQQKLADLEESNEADQLTNCKVFKSKYGEQMEVLVPKNRFSKYQLYFDFLVQFRM